MRLLNVHSFEFQVFHSGNIPQYVIASHRWRENEEVGFKDISRRRNTEESGYKKVEGFARFIRNNIPEVDWLWIDTCCINQSSSQEVSEAVNSMFTWYRNAFMCLAYLADVDIRSVGPMRAKVDTMNADALRQSDWFTRGWTLQELLAPRSVVFLSCEWQVIGHKTCQHATQSFLGRPEPSLDAVISDITGIPSNVLVDYDQASTLSAYDKPAWMAGRQTTRPEDQAYCLFGLFDVTLTIIYGEGVEKAKRRLLLELLGSTSHNSGSWVRTASVASDAGSTPRSLETLTAAEKDLQRLLLKAAAEGQAAGVREMLQLRVEFQCNDENGLTPLHHAIVGGSVDATQTLLTAGVNIDAQSLEVGTPLCLAALRGQAAIFALLLKSGADIHAQGRFVGTPLHCAAWSGSLELVTLNFGTTLSSVASRTLPRKYSPYYYRLLHCQPLVLAAEQGHTEIVKLILDHGFPPNTPHRIWWTPNLSFLPAANSDTSMYFEGTTALMTTAWRGHKDMLLALLAAGADVRIRGSGGRSALALAAEARRLDCMKILREAGAPIDEAVYAAMYQAMYQAMCDLAVGSG